MNGLRHAAWLLLALGCPACSGLAEWSLDRARDLSDVVDVRYGTGLGLGAHVRADVWVPLGAGLGASTESSSRQWFGRKSVEMRDGLFAGMVLIGREGQGLICEPTTGSVELFGVNFKGAGIYDSDWRGTDAWFQSPAGSPPQIDRFRIGATIFLPGVNGGLFINFGELADFFTELVGYDLMRDDGIPKFSTTAD